MQLTAQRKSAAEYLALDECNELRLEYVDGDIYAMTCPTVPHQQLVGNLYWHARRSAGRCCELFLPGTMLRISRRTRFYLPDVMAVCDPAGIDDRGITTPCFIAEILSPSTSRVDRGEKWEAYKTLPTLGEYILVSQDRMEVVVYRDRGPWASEILREPDDVLEVPCIGMRLALADLYDSVKLPPLRVRDVEPVPEYLMTA